MSPLPTLPPAHDPACPAVGAARAWRAAGQRLRLALHFAFLALALALVALGAVAWQELDSLAAGARLQTRREELAGSVAALLLLWGWLWLRLVAPAARAVLDDGPRPAAPAPAPAPALTAAAPASPLDAGPPAGPGAPVADRPAPAGLPEPPDLVQLVERLQRAIGHARRHAGYAFAVLRMEFDRHPDIEATPGPEAGRDLLRQVAQRLQLALRPGDAVARVETRLAVAARVGSAGFVIFLDGVADGSALAVVAERLLRDLAEPYLVGAMPLQGGVCIGAVQVRGGDEPAAVDAAASLLSGAEQLLRDAGSALAEARQGGPGRWALFDPSLHERLVRRMALEVALRQALAEDELRVVYQPVLELATRALAGVEAQLRWQHPQRGLLEPAEFSGVAEGCGLIDDLGAFLLGQACTQFMRWRRELGAMAPGQLSVNLARAQLRRAGLAAEVRALVEDCGMPPECLQFEVTESLAAQDEGVQAALAELKDLGVRLALDDFGTGYASLGGLHRLPVDTVKIDRSFVRSAQAMEVSRVLIEATVRVARNLGMTTVAEGIDSSGQAALMLRLQCDQGQGLLFCGALEAADLHDWLVRQHEAPDWFVVAG
jgi:EAL domain-containing protein (putative c-di-GMP-specific phosphodiesterase class I)/GGDEF domain-containing protein